MDDRLEYQRPVNGPKLGHAGDLAHRAQANLDLMPEEICKTLQKGGGHELRKAIAERRSKREIRRSNARGSA